MAAPALDRSDCHSAGRTPLTWLLIILATAVYFFVNVQRVAIPGAVFDILQHKFHLSAAGTAALGPAFMYVYAIGQLFTGVMVDRFGGGRVIAVGGGLFCLGSAIFAFTDAPLLLYFSRSLAGLGASAFYLGMVQILIRAFPVNYNIAISVVVMSGFSGSIAANAPFTLGVNRFGFENMLLALAAGAIAFYLLYLLTFSRMPRQELQHGEKLAFGKFLEVISYPHNRNLLLFSAVNYGLFYVMQTIIGKKFLEDFAGFSTENAAWIFSLTGLLSALSGFTIAVLCKLSGGRKRLFCIIAGISSFGGYIVLTSCLCLDIRASWLAAVFCCFAWTSSTYSLTIPLMRELNPPAICGIAICLINFVCYIAVGIFGNLTGFLLDFFTPTRSGAVLVYGRSAYLLIFSVFMAVSSLVLFCALRVKETNRA